MRRSILATAVLLLVAVPLFDTARAGADDATITCPDAIESYVLSGEFDVPQSVIGEYHYSCYYRDPARSSTEVLTLHSRWSDYDDPTYCDIEGEYVLASGVRAAFVSWDVSSYDVVEPPAVSEAAAGGLLQQFELAGGVCSGAASIAGSESDSTDASAAPDTAATSAGVVNQVVPSSSKGGNDRTQNILLGVTLIGVVVSVVRVTTLLSPKPKTPKSPKRPKKSKALPAFDAVGPVPESLPVSQPELIPTGVGATSAGATTVSGATAPSPLTVPTPASPTAEPTFGEEMAHELGHIWHAVRHPIDAYHALDQPHRPCARCGAPAAGTDLYCGNCGLNLPPESFDGPPSAPITPDPAAPPEPGLLDHARHELEHVGHDLRHPLDALEGSQPTRPCPTCGTLAPCLARRCVRCGTNLPDEPLGT